MEGIQTEFSNGLTLTFRVLGKVARDRLAIETAEDEALLAENRGASLGPYEATIKPLEEFQRLYSAGRFREAAEVERSIKAMPEALRLVELQVEALPILWRTYRALLRATLIRVDGLTVDGRPVTAEEFINQDEREESLIEAVKVALGPGVQGGR